MYCKIQTAGTIFDMDGIIKAMLIDGDLIIDNERLVYIMECLFIFRHFCSIIRLIHFTM